MEKELGVPKPGDLLIGVIDFFAVLVPGVIAAGLIVEAMGRNLEQANTVFIAGLVTTGWVLGHVLHGIGSWLDPVLYDRLFKPSSNPETVSQGPVQKSNRLRAAIHKYLHKNDDLYRLAKETTDALDMPNIRAPGGSVPGGMYQWARAWLNSHSPKATADLDRLEADSKLFRSLAVLSLIAIPVPVAAPVLFPAEMSAMVPSARPPIVTPAQWKVLADDRLALIILAFAGVLFSLWRYCDLRNKMIRQCYLNYVQLRSESHFIDHSERQRG
jgi:hypothetical protein